MCSAEEARRRTPSRSCETPRVPRPVRSSRMFVMRLREMHGECGRPELEDGPDLQALGLGVPHFEHVIALAPDSAEKERSRLAVLQIDLQHSEILRLEVVQIRRHVFRSFHSRTALAMSCTSCSYERMSSEEPLAFGTPSMSCSAKADVKFSAITFADSRSVGALRICSRDSTLPTSLLRMGQNAMTVSVLGFSSVRPR